ncbi:MAG: Ig-like domain repeat protein, partial [Acidobacteriota bacterium]
TGSHPGDFIKTADTCAGATIAPGNSCAMSVAFAPTAPAARTAALTIFDNAADSPQNVPLSGTAATGVTSTTVASSLNPSTIGQSVTFTAQVTGSGPAPTGTVVFRDGAATLATAALAGGTATFATSSLTVGSHSITAAYSGDASNVSSTSAVLVQTVNPTPPPPQPQTLFFDDFAGPLSPAYAAVFPNPWDRTYLGASGYSFQTVDGASVIRLQNVLGNASVRGWSSSATYSSNGYIRLEARFNTMVQSSSTGIDDLLGLWIFDAANINRFDHIALSAPAYGSLRYLWVSSSHTGVNQVYNWAPFSFANNTWYRMVITGSPTQNVRLSIYDDTGTVELAGVNVPHTLASYGSGSKFGLSQAMGLPGSPYPTDVAIDWLRLTSGPPGSVPTGSGVASQPVDSTTGTSPVSMTFSSVTQAGMTTLTMAPTGPPPPTGFKLGNPPVYYDLGSTATFSGLVTICINYTGINFGNENNLKLLHNENGNWVNITTSLNTTTNIICGATTSLSPFAVLEEEAQAPVVSNVAVAPNPGPVGTLFGLTATVSDAATGGSNIASAEYSVNGGLYSPMSAADGAFNAPTENVAAATPLVSANVYSLCVRGRDAASNVSGPACTLVAVYDPSGGFVTGGGWIVSPPGAYTADAALTGKATFGFVAKYLRGAEVPTGDTQFQFQVASLTFKSKVYEWLVISGARAQFKGSGTINGAGDYGFLLTAIDGQVSGGGGVDQFRIKIWNKQGGGVVYDNQAGKPDTGDDATELGGGSIIIHKQ